MIKLRKLSSQTFGAKLASVSVPVSSAFLLAVDFFLCVVFIWLVIVIGWSLVSSTKFCYLGGYVHEKAITRNLLLIDFLWLQDAESRNSRFCFLKNSRGFCSSQLLSCQFLAILLFFSPPEHTFV